MTVSQRPSWWTRYAFRYCDSAGTWFDDDEVVQREDNGFGGANCVVEVSKP